jgi:hypothetical protein
MVINKTFIYSCFYFLLLVFISLNIPFFWDGTFFSAQANHFYENGFADLTSLPSHDTGGFPLYAIYHALCWKVFGRSLLVSHLIMIPFILGIVYQYNILIRILLKPVTQPFAALLLVLLPVLSAQTVLIGYDLLLVFFFLLSVNGMIQKKSGTLSTGSVLLVLCSVRGMVLLAALLISDLWIHRREWKRSILYLPASVILCLWVALHYFQTGWFLFSPVREGGHESILSADMMLRQAGYFIWRMCDNGAVILWIPALYCMLFQPASDKKIRTLQKIIIVTVIMMFISMVPIANPIGPRYFIAVNVLVCLYLAQRIYGSYRGPHRTVICITIAGILFSGNFWMYPARYGNSWDSSLKIIPWFEAEEKMKNFILTRNIDPKSIGTQFPLISDRSITHPGQRSFSYTNVWQGPVEKFEYMLVSNVINSDIEEQMEQVRESWELVHAENAGQTELLLYRRP